MRSPEHAVAAILAPLDEALEPICTQTLADLGQHSGAFRFRVAPNPCVGAAVLSDGVEIGRGYHEVWGGPHAEIAALAAARSSGVPSERWDTLVCTLEPCSTQGKTPPCVDAIIAAGIQRVVVCDLDPDRRHRGRGLALLHEAGIEVALLRHAAPLERISSHFLSWTQPERLRRRRPWMIAKWAQTRSGQMTPPANVGEGRWISGPMALAEVQVLRSQVDAIVTGIGTVLADDPRLSVRPPGDTQAAPLRVVLDTELRTPPDARLLQATGADESAGPVTIICRAGAAPARNRALTRVGARIHPIPTGDNGSLSLRAFLEWLWDEGVRRSLLEAGPKLLEGFLEASFVDQVRTYTGSVNGGRGTSVARLLQDVRLRQRMHREVGDDSVLEAFAE